MVANYLAEVGSWCQKCARILHCVNRNSALIYVTWKDTALYVLSLQEAQSEKQTHILYGSNILNSNQNVRVVCVCVCVCVHLLVHISRTTCI